MSQSNVLLIAVGGIGFRHFQALLNCRSDFALYVVDISAEALAKAKAYADEQRTPRSIYYVSSVADLDETLCFNLAILATSSLPRKEVFKTLVSRHEVHQVIFEKVLFPRLDDYEETAKLLKKYQIQAYVNCSRRAIEFYQSLKEELRTATRLEAVVSGDNWGLACNSIHLLDLFDFLAGTDGQNVFCDGSFLEDKIFESKRSGYIEFYGRLVGTIGDKVTYSIACGHGNEPRIIELRTDTSCYRIDESAGCMAVSSIGGNVPTEERPFQFPYTSQLTDKIVDRLLSGQPVGLSTYEESCRLHIPLLREFQAKQAKILGEECDLCPIT